jgi:hypothetical protein
MDLEGSSNEATSRSDTLMKAISSKVQQLTASLVAPTWPSTLQSCHPLAYSGAKCELSS